MQTITENNNTNSMPQNMANRHIDYKDVVLLKKFINPHARILSRKKTSLSAKKQRELAVALKRARYLGLLPYVSR